MHCNSCGLDAPLESKFCRMCGEKLVPSANRTEQEGQLPPVNADIGRSDAVKKKRFTITTIWAIVLVSLLAIGLYGLSQYQRERSVAGNEYLVSQLDSSCESLNEFAKIDTNWNLVSKTDDKEIYSLFGDMSGPMMTVNLLLGKPDGIKISAQNYDTTNEFLYFASCPTLAETPDILTKSKPNTSPSIADKSKNSKNNQQNDSEPVSKKNWQDFQACLESNSYLSPTQAREMCYPYNPNSIWGD